jgi:restriction system protein
MPGKKPSMDVWTVKGGQYGEREDRCLEHGVIGGGWSEIPDLSHIANRQELTEICEQFAPQWSAKARTNYVAMLWSLRERMQDGELVVLPLKSTGTIAVGRVNGPYAYREDLGADFKHVRSVKWLATDLPRDNFDQDLLYSFGAFLTVGRVRRDNAEQRILAAMKGAHVPAPTTSPNDEPPEAEAAIDPAQLAREQIRQFIAQTIAGHDLAALVGAVFEARGFKVTMSPPGPDGGVDLFMGSGPTGRESPKIVAQVKTGQAGVDQYRAIFGLKESMNADQALLVAWGGFKGTVKQEARGQHFSTLLWDADELLDALFDAYGSIRDDFRSRLPLQKTWVLVQSGG